MNVVSNSDNYSEKFVEGKKVVEVNNIIEDEERFNIYCNETLKVVQYTERKRVMLKVLNKDTNTITVTSFPFGYI